MSSEKKIPLALSYCKRYLKCFVPGAHNCYKKINLYTLETVSIGDGGEGRVSTGGGLCTISVATLVYMVGDRGVRYIYIMAQHEAQAGIGDLQEVIPSPSNYDSITWAQQIYKPQSGLLIEAAS